MPLSSNSSKRNAPVRLLVLLAAALSGPAALALPDVSGGGRPTYTYPIAVPPGINGLAPSIALEYSGPGSNSVVGYGWQLKAFEGVNRCPANIRIDGKRRGLGTDEYDRLCLDGGRLLFKGTGGTAPTADVANPDASGLSESGPPADLYREYTFENDRFARIRAYGRASTDGSNSAGPGFFRAWSKDGRVSDFGASPLSVATSNALVRNTATTTQPYRAAHQWLVSHVADRFGNVMDYKYTHSVRNQGILTTQATGDEWLLSEITYANNRVIFTYEDRPATSPRDVSERFVGGAKQVTISRLSRITTYINSPGADAVGPGAGVPVKTYHLAYDQGPITKRSRLLSIRECAGGAASTNCLPDVAMTYSQGSNESFSEVCRSSTGQELVSPIRRK